MGGLALYLHNEARKGSFSAPAVGVARLFCRVRSAGSASRRRPEEVYSRRGASSAMSATDGASYSTSVATTCARRQCPAHQHHSHHAGQPPDEGPATAQLPDGRQEQHMQRCAQVHATLPTYWCIETHNTVDDRT